MSTIDIIKQRHSVRRFKDIPLDLKTVEQLNQEIEVCNKESGLHIQLITNEPEAFQGEKREKSRATDSSRVVKTIL